MNRLLLPLVTLVAAVLIVACGGGDSSEPADTDKTAAEILSDASKAAAGLTTFHFKLSHQNGSTPLPLNLSVESAEGDVGVPDKLKADVKADAAGINVSVKVIGIDDETWVTNPFTRSWQRLGGTNIRDFANPAALVTGLLPDVQDPQIAGREDVDGAATYRLTGTIDSAALSDALGIAEPGHTVKVEAWIGVDDSLPRRVKLSGRLTDDEKENVTRQVDLSRFNQPVDIQAP
jgi:hypothetical protein